MMLFPTIVTSKGAKIGFYEPTTVNMTLWDGTNGLVGQNFHFPDGDGYTAVPVADGTAGNLTIGGTSINLSLTSRTSSVTATVGKLTYNFSSGGSPNVTIVELLSPQGGTLRRPAIYGFEEKDDANNYEAFIVTLDAGYDGDSAGLGVSDIVRTVENDAGTNFGNEIQHESNSDLYSDMDLWGTVFTLDKGDSDQTNALISYPDDQVEALVYVGEADSSVTGGVSSGNANVAFFNDDQTSSYAGRNLIVVGGSCVNTLAAQLLGSSTPLCGADFTTATGGSVGANQFLVQTFSRSDGKVATLVAGYGAVDTTNAATFLTTQPTSTMVGDKYVGTSATSAELVTA
jgi:hypothetical protein